MFHYKLNCNNCHRKLLIHSSRRSFHEIQKTTATKACNMLSWGNGENQFRTTTTTTTKHHLFIYSYMFFIKVNRPCDKLHHHQSNMKSIGLYNYYPNFNYSWATVLNVNVNKMQ